MCIYFSWTWVPFMCGSVPFFFFPLLAYFKLFTRQNMKTSCLTALAQYLFNQLNEGGVGCFPHCGQGSSAKPCRLTLPTSLETGVLGLRAGHIPLATPPFPCYCLISPLPNIHCIWLLIGFLSGQFMCRGIKSLLFVKSFHLSPAFFPRGQDS